MSDGYGKTWKRPGSEAQKGFHLTWKIQDAKLERKIFQTLAEAELLKLKISRLGYRFEIEPKIDEVS